MTKKRWMLLILLGVGISLVTLLWLAEDSQTENRARSRLDQLLGQSQSQQDPQQLHPSDEPGANPFLNNPLLQQMPHNPLSGFNGLLQSATNQLGALRNKPQALEWYIPLKKAEDAQRIQVQVLPRQITVQGDFPITLPGGNSLGTSHLMQTQTLPQAVDPKKITRKTIKNQQGQLELVIIMPKINGNNGQSESQDDLSDPLSVPHQDNEAPLLHDEERYPSHNQTFI